VIPQFLGAKLKIKLSFDRVLGEIGQADAVSEPNEGGAGISSFLYVRNEGHTEVSVVLVDDRDKELEDYRRTYRVTATRKAP
jgi:hypothetical protein